jgi:hypothetical protein
MCWMQPTQLEPLTASLTPHIKEEMLTAPLWENDGTILLPLTLDWLEMTEQCISYFALRNVE